MVEGMSVDSLKKSDDSYKFLSKLCSPFIQDKSARKGLLSNYTVSLKDAIWLKDVESTASSDILEGFFPVENSTVASRLLQEGAKIIGKTTQDAFGFGSFSTNTGSGYETPLNPRDKNRSAGGSSGGAAVAAALLDDHIAISESTGGSITTPASFCGVVGICPTYGRVSRSGLITYASSLDKIGVQAKDVYSAALGLQVISGKDDKDETSSSADVGDYISATDSYEQRSRYMKIGLLDIHGVDRSISKSIISLSTKLKDHGVTVDKINLPYTKRFALSSYYIIAMAEASTHLACFSGVRYGNGSDISLDYNEYFKDVRTKGLTEEAKRRVMIGTYVRMAGYRGKYYERALKVRKKIIDEYKKIFEDYDAILCPATPCIAPRFDEIDAMSLSQKYSLDDITSGPNIAGLPNISVPVGEKNDMPFGAMLIADHFHEDKLISLASLLEVLR